MRMYQFLSRVRRLSAVLAVPALVAGSLLVVAPSTAFASSCTVSEDGSTTVYPALAKAQSTWQTASGCNLSLVANSSGVGITDLEKTPTGSGYSVAVQIAASSSALSGNDANALYGWKVGGDAMVLAVNAAWANANGVNHINMNQVLAIYGGAAAPVGSAAPTGWTITNWNQVDPSYPNLPIVPRARVTTSGTYSDLLKKFGINAAAEAYVVANTGLPRFTTTQDEAQAACDNNNPGQLVYTSLANLQAYGPGGQNCLVALALASGGNTSGYVMPSINSVVGGTYPVPRTLYLLLNNFSTMNSATLTDNTSYVKAIDLVNYFETNAGQAFVGQVGFVTAPVPATQAIPDYDVNLDGAIGLGDLGNIIARWGQSSTIQHWMRADANQDGAIGLADLGAVIAHWGQKGFQYSSPF